MSTLIAMPGTWEMVIILAIVILIFGAAKLPDLARATGQSLRIFKAETKGLRDDEKAATPTPPAELTEAADEVAEGEIVDERKNNL